MSTREEVAAFMAQAFPASRFTIEQAGSKDAIIRRPVAHVMGSYAIPRGCRAIPRGR